MQIDNYLTACVISGHLSIWRAFPVRKEQRTALGLPVCQLCSGILVGYEIHVRQKQDTRRDGRRMQCGGRLTERSRLRIHGQRGSIVVRPSRFPEKEASARLHRELSGLRTCNPNPCSFRLRMLASHPGSLITTAPSPTIDQN
jgi:hypothetical protein